jgi:hypothetical protein
MHFRSNGALYAMAVTGQATKIGTSPLVRRRGDALTVSAGGLGAFTFPVLRGVRYGAAAADSGAMLVVTADAWAGYEVLVVSFANDTAVLSVVKLSMGHPERLVVIQADGGDWCSLTRLRLRR